MNSSSCPSPRSRTIEEFLYFLDPKRAVVTARDFDAKAVISRVVIHDGHPEVDPRPGDAILAIGYEATSPDFAHLVEQAAAHQVAFIACRASDAADLMHLANLSSSNEVCIVALRPGTGWDELSSYAQLILRTTAAQRISERGITPNSGLFSLSDTTAVLLNAPVIIDDANMQVIAYSTMNDTIDEARRHSIEQLSVAGSVTEWLESSGTLSRVRNTPGPAVVLIPSSTKRWGIAVRAGVAIVGYIWVATEEELSEQSSRLLIEIARQAAELIVRASEGSNAEWDTSLFMMREALHGRVSFDSLAPTIVIDESHQWTVCLLRAAPHETADPAILAAVRAMAVLILDANAKGVLVLVHSDEVVILAPRASIQGDKLIDALAQITGRASRRFAVVIHAAVGPVVTRPGWLLEAIQLSRSLLQRGGDASTSVVLDYEAKRDELALDELLRFVRDRPHLMAGPVATLWQIDQRRGTEYTRTLAAYFDAYGDPVTAARALTVHRNTLKYRLNRIRELTGLDLHVGGPARLIAELQTRAITLGKPPMVSQGRDIAT